MLWDEDRVSRSQGRLFLRYVKHWAEGALGHSSQGSHMCKGHPEPLCLETGEQCG